jgi:hypothetical protein
MIYLVSLGYDYEGSDVQKAFKSFESAEKYVEEFIEQDSKDFTWQEPWVRARSTLWESSSKYIVIDSMELED